MPDKEREWDEKASRFTIQISTGKVQGYSWGNGEKMILLVHGWAGRATQFRKFIEVLTNRGYCVVGFDGPAHGRSDGKRTDLMQFREAFEKIFQEVGVPEAIIAHSFGGAASLYAAMHGLPISKLVNIASPAVGDEIIKTYLRAINGSWTTGQYFKEYVKAQTGKTFDEFTSTHFVKHLPRPVDLLIVHDEDDPEVYASQAQALRDVYPQATLLLTKGLGHTRILRDEHVIAKSVTFIETGRLQSQ